MVQLFLEKESLPGPFFDDLLTPFDNMAEDKKKDAHNNNRGDNNPVLKMNDGPIIVRQVLDNLEHSEDWPLNV